MAQRGTLPPLRVQVPTLGNAPSQRLSKYHMAFSPSLIPTPVIHQRPHTGRLWIAVLLQLLSLYVVHQWLSRSQEQSLVKFAVLSFFGTSVILGFLQQPWKGRAIVSTQWLLLLLSGGLLALSFMLRMRGLAVVGPLETILAEFAGAVVGKVLIKAQRKVHGIRVAKIRGAVALFAGLYILSQGWAVSSCSPLSSLFVPVTKSRTFVTARLSRSAKIGSTVETRERSAREEQDQMQLQLENDCAKYLSVIAPLCAGLLSSVQRLLLSRTSLGSIPKRRLQALTYVAAGMVFVPVSLFQVALKEVEPLDRAVLWPLFSMIAFGMVGSFYGEFFSEEKLLISPLGPMHFFITACCVCILELSYGSNFSLIGFVVCCALLAVGVRAGAFISGGLDWNTMSEREYSGASVMSLIQTPLYHIWSDVKTRKIALFLLINTSFMVVEFVFGFLSNSLGLISDACHMLFDCAALAIGLYASYISRLPANSKFHFGYGRFEVLSGYANGVFLILVASLIVLESLERLLEPPEISTGSLLIVSVGGLLVNVIGLIFFHEAHHHAHGSGPCMHVHAHHDTFVAIPVSKTSRETDVSLSSHKSSVGPQVIHSHHGHSSSHHHSLDSPILNLQGTVQSGGETHLGSRSSVNSEAKETGARAHSHSPLSHDRTSRLHEQVGDFLHSQNDEKHQDHAPRNHVPDILRGLKDKLNHQHHSVQQGDSQLGAQLGTHSTTAHVHSAGCSHGHDHHSFSSPAVEGLTGKEQAPSHSKASEQQGGFSNESLRRGTLMPETGSPRHSHPRIQAPNKKPVLTRSASAFKNQMVLIQSHHLPHTNNVSGGSHVHGHSVQHHEHSHDQQHEHGIHTHSAFKHQQVFKKCDDHHENSGSLTDSHGHGDSHSQHGHGHSGDHNGHSHSGDHHGHNHGGNNAAGEDKIHLRQLVHISVEHDSGYESDRHHKHDDDKSHSGGHTGKHSHHPGGEPCSHDHSHDHGGHDHDHHHHGHSHGDHDDHRGDRHIDHNMEGIFLHILADTLGSVGVVISTLLIKYKGWLFTDPACSIFISVLIISSVLPLVRNSAELLLQRVPRSAEKRIEKALKKVEVVEGVHDWHKLHVWSYTNTELVGTLRLHASMGTDKQLVRSKVTRILGYTGISDLTLEVEDLEQEDE